jgi:hypothetical protein
MLKLVFGAIISLSLLAPGLYATTHTAASCNASDVTAAIAASVTGDVVVVPGPCTVSWAAYVNIPATKGITVQANGSVTLTGYGFSVEPNAASETRITGFSFTDGGVPQSGVPHAIELNGNKIDSAYRIDHNTFSNTNCQIVWVRVTGNGPGVIDHNTFSGGCFTEEIHNMGTGFGSTAGWTDDVTPGGSQMVFIEDNTFNTTSTTSGCSGEEAFAGARTVVRYNTFNDCTGDQHGTAGYQGARWWEYYNNKFHATANFPYCCVMQLRGGSGVVWGNTFSADAGATGAHSIDLFEEDNNTWPQAWQVGSGIGGTTDAHNSCAGGTLNSSHAYLWGNDSSIPITSQTPSKVALNRDYFVSASQPASLMRQQLYTDTCATTYNYVPYTYPHPLVSSSSVAPPTGLAAVVE